MAVATRVIWTESTLLRTYNLDLCLAQLPRPIIIKIDVRGAGLEVLRDQWKMLNWVRPVMICRVDSRISDESMKFFTSISYCLFDGDKSLNKAKRIDRASWNTTAIPEERKERR
jgi:hypothetical protein